MTKSLEEIRSEFVAQLAALGVRDPAITVQERIDAGLEPEYVPMFKGGMAGVVRLDHVPLWLHQGWTFLKI